jgi:hypothetical protein
MKSPNMTCTKTHDNLQEIPCLRAEMPDYGMQACDLKKNNY